MSNTDDRQNEFEPEARLEELAEGAGGPPDPRRSDGDIEVSVSDDRMRAYADFIPPLGGGRPLSLDFIEKVLEEEGIIYGTDMEAVREAVFACNTQRRRQEGVIVAEGTAPESEVPAYYKLKPRLTHTQTPSDCNGEQVDYKCVSPFLLVKRGEALAKVIPKKQGVPGKDVYGGEVPFEKAEVRHYTPGPNTETRDNVVYAVISGRFFLKEGRFWVSDMLEIQGSVDYHTGHISFPGDVVISGEIKDGFRVRVGGNLTCRGPMDASEVMCKKDVTTEGGIIGRKKGLVRVGGNVTAKFIENSQVESKGSVEVQSSILKSRIFAIGEVNLGEKGQVVGSEIHAGRKITAHTSGCENCAVTELVCGTDFIVQRKLVAAKEKHNKLAVKLQRVDALLSEQESTRLARLKEQLVASITHLSQDIDGMLETLYLDEGAEIVITGACYPGTIVEICSVSRMIDKKVEGVRFSLNKEVGKIEQTPLEGARS